MKRVMAILGVVVTALRVAAVVSPAQVAYDHYFDAATFALLAEHSADTVAYHLVMTYDEGKILVPAGSTLTLHLRDRTAITLATDREVSRGDVLLRRWRDRTNCYITCYYPILASQLSHLLSHDVYRLEIGTARGIIVRSVRNMNSKVAQAFSFIAEHE